MPASDFLHLLNFKMLLTRAMRYCIINTARYISSVIYQIIHIELRHTNREDDGMAPRNKFTQEEMVAAALNVVRANGISALTARAIADELGTSTQPVFTCFGTMDEAKKAVRTAAAALYDRYSAIGLSMKIPFYGFGMQHIKFAKDEPNLYRLLFLTPTADGKNGAVESTEHSFEALRAPLMRIYDMTEEEAARYFRDMCLVGHSIATLIVTGGCPYSDEEISDIITGFSISLCRAIKEIPGFIQGKFDRFKAFSDVIENYRKDET